MFDENGDSARTALGELKRSRDLLEQVIESLNNQKAVLKQRGMNLPPLVLTSLGTVQQDMARIESAMLDDQTELAQLRALAGMSAKINTSLDVDRVLIETMDNVIALTGAERGYIILVDPDSGELEYRITREGSRHSTSIRIPLSGADRSSEPRISKTVVRAVIESGAPLLTDNAFQDDRLSRSETVANYELRSVLCVPLRYREKTIGVVYVDNRLQSGLFTKREMRTLVAFGNTAAVAITNARLYASLRRLLSEITQVKELMDNVFASIGSGVIVTGGDNLVMTVNRAAESILGRIESELIGQPLHAALPKLTGELSELLATVRESRERQFLDGEIDSSGRRMAVNLKLTPLRDSAQETQGVAVVVDDVTDRIEREQQLRVMRTYLPPAMVDNIHTISQLALGGERRDITCLFAEVRPLMTLRTVPPRELLALVNRFLSAATDAIHDSRGIVDKYMGTEIMALYNTQLNPLEDHATQAVEAALKMRAAFEQLYTELGLNPAPHDYRVGIHSGVATLGNVGSLNRRDFTAIGDSINLAKRLQENAGTGQIIISDDCRGRLKDLDVRMAVRFTELEPIRVKGRQQETRVYEIVSHA